MKLLQKYRFGFDAGGLALFLLVMLPNIVWFMVLAPDDILRTPSVTPTLDAVGMVFQALMVAALCCIVRKERVPLKFSLLLIATIVCVILYFVGWFFYYRGIATMPVILILTLVPCLAFICYALNRRNMPAMLFAVCFAVCHLLFGIINFGHQPQSLGEVKSEYVTIDDSVRVHYKKYGQGEKTICFVHGFGCDMNTWEKQFEAFCDEEVRLVFIDLPGYGKSDKPQVEYTFDLFAHAIDEVLNANGIGDAVFVGHSLGTPVCRHTLLTTAHGGALVDVDGVYCFYDGTETPEYVEAVNQFGHSFDGPDCREVITGFVSSLAGKDTPQWVTNYAMSVMPETPQYVASSTMQHLVEKRWWPTTQHSVPVMVVCTQNSGLEPDNQQKMQTLYPNLDYIELTTCGHFIHMEQAEMFNQKLKEFLNW